MNWLTWLRGIPSAFWTSLLNGIKTLCAAVFGGVLKTLWDNLQHSKKMVEQLNDVLEEEKVAKFRPVAGAAERLRNSGYNRKR